MVLLPKLTLPIPTPSGSRAHSPADPARIAHSDPPHHAASGRFVNPWPSAHAAFSLAMPLSWHSTELAAHPRGRIVKNVRPTWGKRGRSGPAIYATWLGHASALVELGGRYFVFDPVFSAVVGPTRFTGVRRALPAPCDVADLPGCDAVFISHNHYDHLDLPTIQRIYKRYPKALYFVPLGVKKWFISSIGVAEASIHEMDWWGTAEVFPVGSENRHIAEQKSGDEKGDTSEAEKCAAARETDNGDSPNTSETPLTHPITRSRQNSTETRVNSPSPTPGRLTRQSVKEAALLEADSRPNSVYKITCTPAQHTSGRSAFDQGATLWCGWVVQRIVTEESETAAGPNDVVDMAVDPLSPKNDEMAVDSGDGTVAEPEERIVADDVGVDSTAEKLTEKLEAIASTTKAEAGSTKTEETISDIQGTKSNKGSSPSEQTTPAIDTPSLHLLTSANALGGSRKIVAGSVYFAGDTGYCSLEHGTHAEGTKDGETITSAVMSDSPIDDTRGMHDVQDTEIAAMPGSFDLPDYQQLATDNAAKQKLLEENWADEKTQRQAWGSMWGGGDQKGGALSTLFSDSRDKLQGGIGALIGEGRDRLLPKALLGEEVSKALPKPSPKASPKAIASPKAMPKLPSPAVVASHPSPRSQSMAPATHVYSHRHRASSPDTQKRGKSPISHLKSRSLSPAVRAPPSKSPTISPANTPHTIKRICPAFKEIGDRLGPFDVSFIPIWRGGTLSFLSSFGIRLDHSLLPTTAAHHGTPRDAVDIHLDVHSRNTIPIHFGTFVGADLETVEAVVELHTSCIENGIEQIPDHPFDRRTQNYHGSISKGRIGVLDSGETLTVSIVERDITG